MKKFISSTHDNMKKAIIHSALWLSALIIVLLVSKTYESLFGNLFWVWLSSVLFYFVNAILGWKHMNLKASVNEDGILSGRLLGIWLNAFVIQYFLEMHEHFVLVLIYAAIGIAGMCLCKRKVKDFLSRNNWKKGYGILYLSMTLLASSALSLLGFLNPDWFLVQDIGSIGLVAKAILMFLFFAIMFLTVIPNNVVAKLISRSKRDQDSDNLAE